LPGKSHGQRRLVGYSLWGHKESDMTERLSFPFILILDQQSGYDFTFLLWAILDRKMTINQISTHSNQ